MRLPTAAVWFRRSPAELPVILCEVKPLSYQMLCNIKHTAAAAALAAVIWAVRRQWSLIGLSDAAALSGICFLILALFRLARYLKFYDLIIYGFTKMKQIFKNKEFLDTDTGTFAEYTAKTRYENSYIEAFIAAAVMFVISVAVLVI